MVARIPRAGSLTIRVAPMGGNLNAKATEARKAGPGLSCGAAGPGGAERSALLKYCLPAHSGV